jgi:tRNA pseudouridine38/39 synthase
VPTFESVAIGTTLCSNNKRYKVLAEPRKTMKSSTSTSSSKSHPFLRKLPLVDGYDQPTGPGVTTTGRAVSSLSLDVSSRDVLSYLLENNLVSENVLLSAIETIREQRQQQQDQNSVIENKLDTMAFTTPNNKGRQQEGAQNGNGSTTTTIATTTVRTRHIALRFIYDGANYSGLAQNMGQDDDNSVERALFEALVRARLVESREGSGYSRCGRTDRGVSAAGQVVALQLKSTFPLDASFDEEGTELVDSGDLPKNEFESISVWTFPRLDKQRTKKSTSVDEIVNIQRLRKEMKEYPYAKILNNLLPVSIRILGWTPVTEDFSARFSASTRTYRYFFCQRQMDLSRIREGLHLLVGKHDFRNFCKMDVEKVYNFERVIHTATVVEVSGGGPTNNRDNNNNTDGVCYLQIVGQAFLWHQIRCIAEVIFMIGRGLESPCIVSELLDVLKHPRKPSYNLAAEKPLVLYDCGYPNLRMGYSVQNLWTVSCQLEEQWEELTLAAARLRNYIESFGAMSVLRDDLIAFVQSKVEERNKKNKRRLDRQNLFNAADNDDLKESFVCDYLVLSLPVPNDDDDTTTTATTNGANTLSWEKALLWLKEKKLVADPSGLHTSIHTPLLERSMGTTYEEKVESIKKSAKRRQKFEDNVIKKRKTPGEDAAFYSHKMKQGGTGI